MDALKRKRSRGLGMGKGTSLGQKKYFDHILRPKESMDSVAWYIWLNPIRRGLVRTPGLYPFAGSFTTTIPKCLVSPEIWVTPYKPKKRQPQKAASTNSSEYLH